MIPHAPSPLPFFYKLNHLSLLRSPGEGSVCLRTRVAYKWSRNTRNTNHNSSFLGSKYWQSLPTTSSQTITLLTGSCINYDNNDVQMKQERTFLLASCILNMKVDSPLFPNIWLFSPDAPTSCVTPHRSSFEQHLKLQAHANTSHKLGTMFFINCLKKKFWFFHLLMSFQLNFHFLPFPWMK